MTGVGLFGLLLALLSLPVAMAKRTRTRLTVFFLAFVMHVAASVLYYQLVSSGGGDAAFYYDDPLKLYGQGFHFNTIFLIYIVQAPKELFGGTMLDYFLVFQAFGFWGIALLMRIFEDIYQEAGIEQPLYIYALLFMPSLHYWTSAVGKDSLFFMAICMALYAAMRFKSRLILLGFALALMVSIRSYVALVASAAFAMTVLFDRRSHPAFRALLFVFGIAATGYAVVDLWTTFKFDITNVDAVSATLAGRESGSLDAETAGNTAVDASYPVRLLSLLFRPFFFDAPGALGLIVSVENALQLLLTLLLVFYAGTLRRVMKQVPFVRYAFVSSLGITLGLAISYYNVGLGIRQEATMILPGFLVVFVAVMAVVGARRAHARQATPAVPDFAATPAIGMAGGRMANLPAGARPLSRQLRRD